MEPEERAGDRPAVLILPALRGAHPGPPWEKVQDAAEEVLLLWSLRNPFSLTPGRYTAQDDQELGVELAGQCLLVYQSPSCLRLPGVTGSVLWDSGVVLAKFLEHMRDCGWLRLSGARCLELGAGCGLVGCAAALLGAAHVTLTDQYDRLRLLTHNVVANLPGTFALLPDRFGRIHTLHNVAGSSNRNDGQLQAQNAKQQALRCGDEEAVGRDSRPRVADAAGCMGKVGTGRDRAGVAAGARQRRSRRRACLSGGSGGTVSVQELLWGRCESGPGPEGLGGPFDIVLASDVVYAEDMVKPLLDSIAAMSGPETLTFLTGELRNDAVWEFFLEAALPRFHVGRAQQGQHLHPEYAAERVVLYCLLRK